MPKVMQTQGLNNLIDVGAYNAFADALRMVEPQDIFSEIGTVLAVSGMPELRLPFLWFPPRAREWVGSRERGALQGGMTTIRINTYEATIAVPRSTVEDQMVSVIEARARELATEYMRFVHERYISILTNGTSLTTFDGQPLLTSSPAARGANNVNLASALALKEETLRDARAALQLYTDPDGRPLGLVPTHLLVGPKLEHQARQLVESQTIVITGGGSTPDVRGAANVFYGRLQVIVSPYITDEDWYLIAAGANQYRPVVRVDRADVPMEFAARTSPQDNNVFDTDTYEWGIRFRHGFGPGAWYAVYASQF